MSDAPWAFIRWRPHPSIPEVDVAPLSVPVEPLAERCWLCLGNGDRGKDSAPRSCPCCDGTGRVVTPMHARGSHA